MNFTVEVLEQYYRLRLLDFAHCRSTKQDRNLKLIAERAKEIDLDQIVDIGGSQYIVPSADESNIYLSSQ